VRNGPFPRPAAHESGPDPIELLPTERGRHPIEDLALHDETDPVLRPEDVLRDPERRADPRARSIVGLRADERFARASTTITTSPSVPPRTRSYRDVDRADAFS